MKFTLSWLKEHLVTEAGADAIAATLNRIGLEVEDLHDPAAALAGFKVVEVRTAAQHPNADRLKVTTVFNGQMEQQVVCGAPNCRAGMKAILAPIGASIPSNGMVMKKTQIRGQDSNGMLCSYSELGIEGESSGIIDIPSDIPVGTPAAAALGVNDAVFEIGLTPNRGDCAGIRGIARDLAAAGLGTLKPLPIPAISGKFPSLVHIQRDCAAELAPLFAGRAIRNIKNIPSPAWLQQRLRAIGLRPISALVDITNYFTFDLNRPLHVFDADKIAGGTIHIRTAKVGEKLLALNGKEYALTNDMVVIADANGPESLAGIMGGEHSGCTEDTTHVFIEAALWDPVNIARTGRALGINSDARYRFERGVDPAFTLPSVELATQMIIEICGGEASELVQAGSVPDVARSYTLRTDRVATLGGLSLPAERQSEILQALGFTVTRDGEKLKAAVPSWRSDILGEADLVEEILRIHGYDHVPATPARADAPPSLQSLNTAHDMQQTLRNVALSRGFTDAVTWSFVPQAQAELFGGGAPALQLTNPISVELSSMRPSIIPGLLQAAGRNANQGHGDISLCEIGPVFQGTAPDQQPPVLAMLRAGSSPRHWQSPARPVDFYAIKADLWAILGAAGLNTETLTISRDVPSHFHPGQALAVTLGKTVIAYAGMLHPVVKRAFDVDSAVAAAEIFITRLPQPKNAHAKPLLTLNPLQPVRRDLAFVVSNDVAAGALRKSLLQTDPQLIADVTLFDVYQGKHLPPGQKSLAFAITLQPAQQTMNDAEINTIMDKLVSRASELGATLRR